MAFYQKYRSQTFGEMVGQDHVTKTLLESVKSDRFVHAYLLTGPRGIGKTSTARLLAKAINCEEVLAAKKAGKPTTGEPCNKCDSCLDINQGRAIDVVEIDAASNTGVDNIRELIEKSKLLPSKLSKKIYIIDEVHMLSKGAFNALLKTLEEPPNHVVFILATTEIQKIPATILSRAQRFDFKRAQKEEIVSNLERVAKSEKIKIDSDSLDLIAVLAAGAHRDALSLLEQVASAGEDITLALTRQILGIADSESVHKFTRAIFSANSEEGLKIAHELYADGTDMAEFNRNVIEQLRQVLIIQAATEKALIGTNDEIEKAKELSCLVDRQTTIAIIEIFIETANLLKDSAYPVLPIEMAIVRAVALLAGVAEKQSGGGTEGINSKQIQNSKSENQNIQGNVISTEAEKSLNNETIEQSNNFDSVPPSTAPVPVVYMTKDIWEQVIELTKKQNATLAALLRDAKPEAMTNNTLTIGVKFKFHKDRISESKHAEILGKIVSDITGNNCHVVCKINEVKPQTKVSEPVEDLSQIASEVFEVE